MTQLIFVYHDYAHHTAALWFALVQRYGHDRLRYVNADDIKAGVLDNDPALFIMPGGASRYVSDKLNGAGNTAIKHYVARGGKYFGICAGAYYGCATIYWRHGVQKLEMKNELAFYQGAAQGPIKAFCHDDHTSRLVTLNTPHGKIPSFYWGGGHFFDVEKTNAQVLATYDGLDDNNTAIVQGRHAEGHYLLSSPHPEIDHTALELMRFNVVDNRYASLLSLGDSRALTLDYFYTLTDDFLTL